jgi:formamidopyrimidine-DNA glycosylase
LAKEKPSPSTENFYTEYFDTLRNKELDELSVKTFLATEQLISRLGNGILQDILFNAKVYSTIYRYPVHQPLFSN